ncbi:MAG: hypothetical protein HN521_12475 [Candidatus Latescibacteria bacterium]|jgi:hypothetical protein|nr:hypothetical protein [Candidatus Latescibacterota bacterium]MBT5828942.1 hypothetical protein [Candidatus Latescibacterota bacterium]
MNSVAGVQGSGSFYSRHQVDQAKDIRFENALAAARTAENNPELKGQKKVGIDQVDLGSVLPTTKHPSAIPESKMIQSLNMLVQNNPTENYGTLDIRQ